MRVVFEEDVKTLPVGGSPETASAVTCLLDLQLPCNMQCEGCSPRPQAALLTDAAVKALADSVLAHVEERGATRVDLVLFGGEPLLDAGHVLALASRLRRVCARRGIAFVGHLITNGTLLGEVPARRLVEAGLSRLQVTLDGPRGVHDARRRMLDGGGSWRRIVEGLRYARKSAQVVVRSDAAALSSNLEELLAALDADEPVAGDGTLALYVARPASYPQQARELVDVFRLLEAPVAGAVVDAVPSAAGGKGSAR